MAERTNFPEHLSASPYQNGTNGVHSPPPQQAEPISDDVSIHDVIEVLFKNKWIILTCFVVVLASVAIYTLRQDPEYESASTVYVNSPQASVGVNDLIGAQSGLSRNIANEIEILKSRKIALMVADELLDIENVPGTDQRISILGDGPKLPGRLSLARQLQWMIQVRPVGRQVDIIELTATSTVPKEAALIANLFAEQYVEYNRNSSRSRASVAREFLDEVSEQIKTELEGAENDLSSFLQQERTFAPDQEGSQLIAQVSGLEMQQSETQLQLMMAQAELDGLTDQLERVKPGLANQLVSQDDRVIEGLRNEIAQIDLDLSTRYSKNPELRTNPELDRAVPPLLNLRAAKQKELEDRTESLLANIEETGGVGLGSAVAGESVNSGLGRMATLQQQVMEKQIEVSGLQARLNMINRQRGQVQSELRRVPRREIIMNGLERSLQTREQLYMNLIQKLQEARIAEQSELGFVDIVDRAIVSGRPVRPRVQINLMLGAVVGLLLGLGLAFVRNAFDNKVRKPEDLRRRGYSVIGVVPKMDRVIKQDFKGEERVVIDDHDYSTKLISMLNPLSPVSEGYRRLRTNIQFSRPDSSVHVIMVTSPSPGEGKTVTALNLAITMAQAGRRTLYVDADLRRPEGHRMMGLSREPGLVDLLFDSIPDNIEQFATSIDSYLYVLPAGRDVPNPAEVLGSRKMEKFIERWKQEFDVIIVDTPPVLIVSDALILGSLCHGIVMVCSANETNWQAIDRSAEALQGVGADVIGVLLNRFDIKEAYGGYKYGYGYGYEYSYYNNYFYGRKPEERGGKSSVRKA